MKYHLVHIKPNDTSHAKEIFKLICEIFSKHLHIIPHEDYLQIRIPEDSDGISLIQNFDEPISFCRNRFLASEYLDSTEENNQEMDNILEEDKKIHSIPEINSSSAKIFIIHGHDNELKREVQLLLTRTELQDVVLHEQPNRGRTIIEKLIEESEGASFAIVLLSPDDELAEGTKRARQNVILELGYFLGKLGRSNVHLIKKGDVEIPSDIQGILYTDYDERGAWRIKLLKEMKDAGINLDIDNAIKKF